MLAYVGPDVMLPMASTLAAVLGGVLFAWRWIAAFFVKAWGWLRGAKPASEDADSESPGHTATHVAPVEAATPATTHAVTTPDR